MILVYFILLVFLQLSSNFAANENFDNYVGCDMPKSDVDLVEFPLNLEYLEAEFFLWGSLGYGLDKFAPELAGSGPPPIGAQIAKLSPLVRDVITQFGFQEVGHLSSIILRLTRKDREDISKTFMLRMSKSYYLVLDGNKRKLIFKYFTSRARICSK
ncbi:hypothetical protein P3L10_027556 [Capsicum annuum]